MDEERPGPEIQVPEVVLSSWCARGAVALALEGKRLAVRLVKGEKTVPIGSIDRETGEIDFDFRIELDEVVITGKSEADPIGRLAGRAAAAAREGGHRAVNPLHFLLRAASTVLRFLGDADEAPAFEVADALLESMAGPLPTLEAGPEQPGGLFEIPYPEDPAETHLASYRWAFLAAMALIDDLPAESWPPTLLRESYRFMAGKTGTLEAELRRIFNSPIVGPIGYWAFAETLGLSPFAEAKRRFARMGIPECTARGFRKDLAIIEWPGSKASMVLRWLGKAVKSGDLRLPAAPEGGGAASRRARRLLELISDARAAADDAEGGKRLLEGLWEGVLLRPLQARLERLAGD